MFYLCFNHFSADVSKVPRLPGRMTTMHQVRCQIKNEDSFTKREFRNLKNKNRQVHQTLGPPRKKTAETTSYIDPHLPTFEQRAQ